MRNIFTRCARAIRTSFEPLADDMPVIEWIKMTDNDGLAAFAKQYCEKLASKLEGADIIMRAQDGRFFEKKRYDKRWLGDIEGKMCYFKSPYLDYIVDRAIQNGLTAQPNACEIKQSLYMSRRIYLTTEPDSTYDSNILDKKYPGPPIGFSDFHTPQDFEQDHPDFAAYLKEKGYIPFRNIERPAHLTRAPAL